ncbi:MAG TPA: DUF4911 domain-containing protein [Nitrospinota bacterium]|nr:DUF4911 domain-containing protein [Nitrospinota bacterium]
MKHKKTIKIIARVKKKDIMYINSIIEAYEGMMVMRTIDPKEATVEFDVSPYFYSGAVKILSEISKETFLEIIHKDKIESYE